MLETIRIKEKFLEIAIHYYNEKGLTITDSKRTDDGYILTIERIKIIWEKQGLA